MFASSHVECEHNVRHSAQGSGVRYTVMPSTCNPCWGRMIPPGPTLHPHNRPPPPAAHTHLTPPLAVKQLILFTCILDYDPAICDIYPVVSNVLREAPLTFGPKCCCGYTRTASVFPVCRRIDSAGSSQSQEFLQHNEVTMFISKSASDKTWKYAGQNSPVRSND